MREKITLEMAEDIGLIPKIDTFVDTGKLLFWNTSRNKTESEYRADMKKQKIRYRVDENDLVEFERENILKLTQKEIK